MYKLSVVLIFSLVFPMSLFAQVANVNLPDIIKICESYKNNINDVNIEYSFEMIEPESQMKCVGAQKGHFVGIKPFEKFYKSILLFITEDDKGNRRGHQVNVASDGNTYISSDDASDKIKTFDRFEMTPLCLTLFNPNEYNSALLNASKNKSTYNFVFDPNIIKVNDFNSVEVDCIHASDYSAPRFKVAFSVDHNYTIVRYIINVSESKIAKYDILQLKDLENGIWFPVKGVYEFSGTGFKKNFTVENVWINQGLTGKNLINTD